ncbi:cyclin PHO80-like protein, partial [Gaertneriomyces semiglobifer]
PNCSTKLVPLRQFVSQLLERSRTSWTTLQLTLFYLLRIRNTKPKHLNTSPNAPPANPLSHCGRRMFLAALMVAQKWAQDKNYSAKAWSQITGLKCSDLCALERAFLERIDWKLFINAEKFTLWNRAL